MKYERLTERRETPLVMSMWAGDSESLKVYNRLSELEDKIESGELVEVPEVVKKFAEKLKSHVILNYTMDGEFVEDINIWSLFKDIDDLVEEV